MSEFRFALVRTSRGVCAAVCTSAGVCHFVWPQRSPKLARKRVAAVAPPAVEIAAAELPAGLASRLADYFAGKRVTFDAVPVDLSNQTPFRARVLTALRRVDYGRTTTYQQLARAAGRPGAARAVGGAMAANPLPVILPCHRVLQSDGSLGGFSGDGGTATKRQLLEMERDAKNR